MKLQDCQKAYAELSGKASDVSRTLAFSGIALIWVFTSKKDQSPTIPQELLLPGILITYSLTLDLLQYVFGTLFWGGFARYKEKKGATPESEVMAPRWLNWPQNTAFWLKIVLIALAYVFLLKYFGKRLLG